MGNTIAAIDADVAPSSPRPPPSAPLPPPPLSPREQANVDLFGELLRRADRRGVGYIVMRGDPPWWGQIGNVRELIDRYLDAPPPERPGILFEIEQAQVAREFALADAQLPGMIDAHLVEENFDVRMRKLQAENQARWDALGTAWEAFIGLAGAGALPGAGPPELPPELETPPFNLEAQPAPETVEPPATPVERPPVAPAAQPSEELHIEFVDEPATAEDSRGIELSRGSFRARIRRLFRVEKEITDRRHEVADATTRRVLEVIANTVDDPIRIINNALIARGDRPYTGNDVYEAARRWQLNIFNDPRNIVVGPSAENQQLGRDLADEIRETGHTDIMGPAVIDPYGRDAEGNKLPDPQRGRP